MKIIKFIALGLLVFSGIKIYSNTSATNPGGVRKVALVAPKGKEIAAFAEGCFWHAEIIFESVVGVDSAISGYAGGKKANPTYDEVGEENTGHAETVLVYYNPKIVSYKELLNVFYQSHNPTTLNRQGNDFGPQYRSVIFYKTPEEQKQAMDAKAKIKGAVTQLLPLTSFYRAEQYHQDYIAHNPNSPYVRGVSLPDFEEFKSQYKGNLKKR